MTPSWILGLRSWGIAAVLTLSLFTSLRAVPQDARPKTQDPRPSRIVSLVPAVTEMLFAMGAGNEVVGVSSYDKFPPEVTSRPKVGALVDPDFERILTLRPDLVIVYGSQDDLISRLTKVKIPFYNYRHGGLADITTTIRELGVRIGRGADAARVAGSIEAELAATRARVAGRPRPKTMLIFGREPGTIRGLFASGGYGFMHDMITAAGGDDVYSDLKQQGVKTSTEMILARAPEVVIEVHPEGEWTPERIARERQVWTVLPSLPAVRNNRIYIIADDRVNTPGPRVGAAVRALSELLHR